MLNTNIGGVGTAALDALLGKVFGTIAKPFYGKTGKLNLGLPKKIQKSAEEQMNTVYGPKIGQIIDQIKNKSVDTASIISRLNDVKKEALLAGDEAAGRAIDAVIKRVKPGNLISTIAPEATGKNILEAFATKKAFGKDILKPSGEVRISTGNKGEMAKLAKAISGDQLQKLIIEETQKAGIKDAPKIFEKYSALAKLANQMETKPFGGYQAGYLLPLIIGGLIGNNPTLTAAGSVVGAAAMPYTRFLIPQLLGRMLEGIKTPLVGAGSSEINKLQKNQEKYEK
jgi:hypothetical protein